MDARKRKRHQLYALLSIIAGLLLLLVLVVRYEKPSSPPSAPPQIQGEKTKQAKPSGHPDIAFEELTESNRLRAPKEIDQSLRNGVPEHGIALIMDDVGYDLKALDRVLALPIPVAISILPDAPTATESARRAHASGHTVMLHLPMEPTTPKYRQKMTPAFLRGDMDEAEIRSHMEELLARVPYVVGVNNHMGSLLTTLDEPMQWVMDICRQHDLFFIDSKTVNSSVAAEEAARAGLKWGERRIFLDHSVAPEDLEQAWKAVRRCAENNGSCIVIAHPHKETLDFLEHHIDEADKKMFHPVMALLHGGGGSS